MKRLRGRLVPAPPEQVAREKAAHERAQAKREAAKAARAEWLATMPRDIGGGMRINDRGEVVDSYGNFWLSIPTGWTLDQVRDALAEGCPE